MFRKRSTQPTLEAAVRSEVPNDADTERAERLAKKQKLQRQEKEFASFVGPLVLITYPGKHANHKTFAAMAEALRSDDIYPNVGRDVQYAISGHSDTDNKAKRDSVLAMYRSLHTVNDPNMIYLHTAWIDGQGEGMLYESEEGVSADHLLEIRKKSTVLVSKREPIIDVAVVGPEAISLLDPTLEANTVRPAEIFRVNEVYTRQGQIAMDLSTIARPV